MHSSLYSGKSYYVVMELVDGLDGFEYLQKIRFHSHWKKLQFITKIAFEVVSALADYERLKLVHKDLKLENVVLHEVLHLHDH